MDIIILEAPLDQPALIMAEEGEAAEAPPLHQERISQAPVLLFRIQVVHSILLDRPVQVLTMSPAMAAAVAPLLIIMLFLAASLGLLTQGLREAGELLLLLLVNGNIRSMQCWLRRTRIFKRIFYTRRGYTIRE
jgi:hypothetical protein